LRIQEDLERNKNMRLVVCNENTPGARTRHLLAMSSEAFHDHDGSKTKATFWIRVTC
jgi:hypothetical protein